MNKTKTKEITFTEALGIIMVFILFITSPIWLIGTWVILVSIALNKEVFYPAKLILSIDFLIVIMLSLYVILYYIEKKENKMNNFVSMDIKKLGETIRGRPCFTIDCRCQNYYTTEKGFQCFHCGTFHKKI